MGYKQTPKREGRKEGGKEGGGASENWYEHSQHLRLSVGIYLGWWGVRKSTGSVTSALGLAFPALVPWCKRQGGGREGRNGIRVHVIWSQPN